MQNKLKKRIDECNQLLFSSKYNACLNKCFSTLKLAEKHKHISTIAVINNIIGACYFQLGKPELALEKYLIALDYMNEAVDKLGYSKVLNNIGSLYKYQQQYSLALKYFEESLNIRLNNNFPGIENLYNNIGTIYQHQKLYVKAETYYLKALENKTVKSSNYELACTYSNLADLYLSLNKTTLAEKNVYESLNEFSKIDNKPGILNCYNIISQLLVKQKKLDGAIDILHNTLSISRSYKDKEHEKNAFFALSEIYNLKKDYKKSFYFLKKHLAVKDKYLNELSNKKIAELESKYKVEQREKEIALLNLSNSFYKKEIQLAQNILQNIIPENINKINGLQAHGILITSTDVGGDYFNLLKINEHQSLAVIADVSGKGVPASLVVSNLDACIKTQLLFTDLNLTDLVKNINVIICQTTNYERFVSIWLAVIDTKQNLITSINAGHPSAILIKASNSRKKAYLLEAGTCILGMFDILPSIKSEQLSFKKGDILFAYTDGVTEAFDKNEILFEQKVDVNKFLLKQKVKSTSELIYTLKQAVQKHTGKKTFDDDFTCIAIERM
jgi:serine phosphatase RsbU (regulator of sigma subunit)